MVRGSSRQSIIQAATELMSTGGPEALTAAALAQAAGVSKATLFHHFESLDDIVLEAFEQFIRARPSLGEAAPASLRAWLLALGSDTSAAVGEAPKLSRAYFAFVSRAQSDPRLRRRLLELASGAAAKFTQTIARYRPKAAVADNSALASLVLIAGDGLAVHRGLFPEWAASQEAAWRAFVDLVAPEGENE
jgi:AcrR family transcriptional regulator